MNIIEIKKINDLAVVLNAQLVIHRSDSLENENIENMWCISVDKDHLKTINANDFVAFIDKLLLRRQQQIKKKLLNGPITFYLWFDLMADQLRLNFIPGHVEHLPFGCMIDLVERPNEIIKSFIKKNTRSANSVKESIKQQSEENDFILSVYVKYLD
ncbi:MAG: hypothetical protein BWY54_00613 [Candidatus Dependentiae bacterium ADurb.Bin331]|nr:MAG: hypothetical protein BWY54_00613 [Candidatus Dependentiae bacterium ADurb.Bin331]